jgi:hypothetical protein
MSERDDAELATPAPEGETALLPEGKCCADCAHFQRCHWLLSRTGEETVCDWIPSRFRQHATPTPAWPARPVRPHTPGWKIPAPTCPHGRERDFCTECLPTPTPGAWHCEPCATIHVGDCPQGHVSEVRRLRLDCARLTRELAEARAEVTRLREAGKQFAEEIEHGCLACCGDLCEGTHVDDTREAIDTFRRALGGEA